MSADPEPVELSELYGAEVNFDDVFGALTTPRSRYFLAYLNERDTPVALEEAATDVAAWELDCDPSEITEDTKQSMLTSLYHARAPKLAEAGLIEFDPDGLTVGVSDTGAQLEGVPFLPDTEQTA